MNQLTTQTAVTPLARLDTILSNKLNMSPRTKTRYRRALERAIENGVNVMRPEEAAAWGNQLTTSNRAFFRASLRLLGEQLALDIKTHVTPETVLESQAALMRIDAMTAGIEKVESKGDRAHTWLSRAQVVNLLQAPDTNTLKGRRDYIVLALAVGAGLRREELVTLTWANIKTQGARVSLQVMGKGRKNRVIPISAPLAKVLKQWQDMTGGVGYIARSITKGGKLGTSLSGVGVLNIIGEYGQRVGVESLQPHDLRRTYAQIGYESGVPITQISILLGHANTATTERYLNVKLDMKETISDFIPFNGTAVWK